MNVKGNTAIVTGSSRGIGEGIAVELAKRGANVVIVDLNGDRVNSVVDRIRLINKNVIGICADVSIKENVEHVVEKVVSKFGNIDILVNNAGIVKDALLKNMEEKNWDDVINVNLKSVFLFSKTVSKAMIEQKYGRIINISSVSYMGNIGQSNYSASKGGMVSFTKSIAMEIAKYNITANVIAPGFIETPLVNGMREDVKERLKKAILVPRLGKTEDIAHAVLFLASRESGYITGQVLNVCGGMSVGIRL